MSRRLRELAAIALWPANKSPEGARLGSYDILIVCPYLSEFKRTRLHRLLESSGDAVGVIELQDRPGAGEVDVVRSPQGNVAAFSAVVAALSSP